MLKAIVRDRWIEILILVVAAGLRIALLGIKPPHFDEGVNGFFLDQMRHQGFYLYDPENYHGPLHFYVLFISQTLFGRNLWALRMPVVIVSIAAVLMMLAFERFVGRNAARWAAAGMALSTAAVFYGRYAIHESWMLLFLLMTLWGLAGMWRFGDRRSLLALCAGTVGLILTKETYIIHLGCMALAALTLFVFERISFSAPLPLAPPQWNREFTLRAAVISLFVIILIYAGFFLDPEGVAGIGQTFALWFETGKEGKGHAKPMLYWLQLMLKYEWPAVLGLIAGVPLVLRGSDRFVRFVAIYGAGTLLAYSIIPYKTPWCILALLWPFWLVLGAMIMHPWLGSWRKWVAIPVALALGVSTFVAVRLNFFRYTDEGEEYVYVQTYSDIDKLMGPLAALLKEDPTTYHLAGRILCDSYHPLPWLLGDFTDIGYYKEADPPDLPRADFVLVETPRFADVEGKLSRPYFKEPLRLRSGEDDLTLYLNAAVFSKVMDGREPEFVPEP